MRIFESIVQKDMMEGSCQGCCCDELEESMPEPGITVKELLDYLVEWGDSWGKEVVVPDGAELDGEAHIENGMKIPNLFGKGMSRKDLNTLNMDLRSELSLKLEISGDGETMTVYRMMPQDEFDDMKAGMERSIENAKKNGYSEMYGRDGMD